MIFQKRNLLHFKLSLLIPLFCFASVLKAQRCGYDYIVAVVVKVVDEQGNRNIPNLKLSFVSPNSKELSYQDFNQPQVYISEDMGTPTHRFIRKSADYDKPMLFWQNNNAERNYPALGKPSKLNLKEDAYVLFLDMRNLQNDHGMGKIPKMVKLRIAFPNKKNKKLADSIIEIPFDLNYHVALCGSRLVEKDYQPKSGNTQGYQEKYHNGEPFNPVEIDISNPNFSRYSPKSNLIFLQPLVHAKSDFPRADSLYAIKAIAVYSASTYKLIQKIDIPNPLYLSKNHGKAIEIMDFYGDNPAKILDFRVLIAEHKDNLGEGYRKHLHFTYDTIGKVFRSDTFLNAYSNIELNPEARIVVRWEYENKPNMLNIHQYKLENKQWKKINTFNRPKPITPIQPVYQGRIKCLSNNAKSAFYPMYPFAKRSLTDTFIFVNNTNKKVRFNEVSSNLASAFKFPERVNEGDTFSIVYTYNLIHNAPYFSSINHDLRLNVQDVEPLVIQTNYSYLSRIPDFIDSTVSDSVVYGFNKDSVNSATLSHIVIYSEKDGLMGQGLISKLPEDNFAIVKQGKWFSHRGKFSLDFHSWILRIQVNDDMMRSVTDYNVMGRKNGKWKLLTRFNKNNDNYVLISRGVDSIKVEREGLQAYYLPIYSEYLEDLYYTFILLSPNKPRGINRYNGVKNVVPYDYIKDSYYVLFNWSELNQFYLQQHPNRVNKSQIIPHDTLFQFAQSYLIKRFPKLFGLNQIPQVNGDRLESMVLLHLTSPQNKGTLNKIAEYKWVSAVSQAVLLPRSESLTYPTALTGMFNVKLKNPMGYDSLLMLKKTLNCELIQTQPEGTFTLKLSQKIIEKSDYERLFKWLDHPNIYNCNAEFYSPIRVTYDDIRPRKSLDNLPHE